MKLFRITIAGCIAAVSSATFAPAAQPAGVGFEQRLGESIPGDLPLRDMRGRLRPVDDFLQGRPAVLWFGYANCPQLCSVVGDGMVTALRALEASAGKDFNVIAVSIDPTETDSVARQARDAAIAHYGRAGAERGWHYLRGDTAAIRALTDAAGFHFTYDPRSQQYAHPSGFLVLTPRGKISAYFLGVDFAPKEIAAALKRAECDGVGGRVVDLLLACFRGDTIGGRYGVVIWRTLGVAVALTVLALAGGIGRMLWTERQELRRAREKRNPA
ncbi:MAG: hypothetical protein JWM32_791 [Verrucomicrobia bacterium]|nr:hypothetical protein [Verrucomicrobiota bacterium]